MEADAIADVASIGILQDRETIEHVDYVFVVDVWGKDPRFAGRLMQVGQRRGLFRIQKSSLQVELLRPMEGDGEESRFARAAGKVLNEFKAMGEFPGAAQFASG